MIFFTKKIPTYKTKTGMTVRPIPVTLADGRKGFMLGDNWTKDMENKGAEIEAIFKSDISTQETW